MGAVVGEAIWTVAQLEELTLELLAELLTRDPGELRHELVQKGAAMPVDSLDMFDILTDFSKRTGLRLPKRKLRRRTMRSVRAFCEFAAREGRR